MLAAAGVRLVGENRAQDLAVKVAAHGDLFQWDFIGALQSRKVRAIVPHVRLVHSLASESVLRQLERHRELIRPGLQMLVEVNIAREPGKAGIDPRELDAYLERSPVPIVGLMCMPPLARSPRGGRSDESRRWFSALRELARRTRARRAVDGHVSGLRRRGRGGRDNRAHRHQAVRLDALRGPEQRPFP